MQKTLCADHSQKEVVLSEVVPVVPETVADQNPALVYLSSLAHRSRRTMRSALQTVARLFGKDILSMPWANLTYAVLQAARTKLSDSGLAPSTTNTIIAAVRGTMRSAWRLGLIDAETYARLRDVPLVRGSRLPAGRALPMREISALFKALHDDASPAGRRDAAILAVAYACGLRRAEIAGLDLENLAGSEDGEEEAYDITVIGKGNKQRKVFLNDGGAKLLSDYLIIRGDASGPLFFSGKKGGQLMVGRRISDQAIYDILRKRARIAGVADLSPHDMRRTFITTLLSSGTDIGTTSRLAGHRSIQTTLRYDRRDESAMRKASKALTIPSVDN